MKKKFLTASVLTLCAVALVVGSVLTTIAFLADFSAVSNTFTVGSVGIDMKETKVDINGVPVEGAAKVDGNSYHLVPNTTYVKDPTLTVKAKSEDSYVRVLLSIDHASEFDAIYAPNQADLTTIFNGYDATNWVYEAVTRDMVKNTVFLKEYVGFTANL